MLAQDPISLHAKKRVKESLLNPNRLHDNLDVQNLLNKMFVTGYNSHRISTLLLAVNIIYSNQCH